MSGLGQRVAKPVGSEKDVSKGRVQTTTVRRYWAGAEARRGSERG